jgi:hypothetical protein
MNKDDKDVLIENLYSIDTGAFWEAMGPTPFDELDDYLSEPLPEKAQKRVKRIQAIYGKISFYVNRLDALQNKFAEDIDEL